MIPTPQQAYALLQQYTEGEFLLKHGRTVGDVLRWFAEESGNDADYWQAVGYLHDIDYEKWPEEHCVKCVELLTGHDIDEGIIRSVVSHGCGICSDVKPEHYMEKVLFAVDELTGLIGAAAAMRPSKSCSDLEVKSLKKKFKDKKFAAGCSRDVIMQGAEMLGWELDVLMEKTILAMRSCE
ncbi:MAG: hydrolase [Oscillospiraceae bacterium]|nr:hydrolase [Oscillospiraceae bacterium]